MNIYSNDIYAAIVEDDAAYSHHAVYNEKLRRNARRAQRKAKQAQRNQYWDSF